MNYQQMQSPQQQQQGHKTAGIVCLMLSAMLVLFGLCSVWILGLGLIPIILAIPLFITGIILMLV